MNLFSTPQANIFYFPFWWYTQGLKKKIINFIGNIKRSVYNLALKIMFKYLFRPMFGETSKAGRIISFFMRLLILIYKLILFILNLAWQTFLLILWIGILPVTIYSIIRVFTI
ncbi:MAG: hypothetical protein BWY03_00214 [Parcubacteria group bacterium ADurb.Bin159]|jgi:hypothetical protein|nr:MAG: hypothetical protein BWY03_00214 [Parcubacteria group bacterium ADurb.Bin159]